MTKYFIKIFFIYLLAFFELNGKPLKLVEHFTYLGSNISSIKSDFYISIGKVWAAIDRLSIN